MFHDIEKDYQHTQLGFLERPIWMQSYRFLILKTVLVFVFLL